MRRYLTTILFVVALMFSSFAFAEDEYELGCEAYDVGDYDTALASWLPAAQQGDAESQNNSILQ